MPSRLRYVCSALVEGTLCLTCPCIKVIIGTVAAKDTPSELSRAALKELEYAIALFDLMTDHPVVRNGLVRFSCYRYLQFTYITICFAVADNTPYPRESAQYG